MRKVLPIILVVAAAAVAGVYVGRLLHRRGPTISGPALAVSFMDEARGGGAVVRTPTGAFLVIDPGPRECSAALLVYLRSREVRSADVLVTSPSASRAGALGALAQSIRVKRLYRGEHSAFGRVCRDAATSAGKGFEQALLRQGSKLRLPGGVRAAVLSPPGKLLHGTGSDRDNNSLVVRLSLGRKSILCMSDVRVPAEAELIQSGTNLRSDVLVVARSGRLGSTCLELVREVGPEVCVVSAQSRHRPSATVMGRVSTRNTGADLYRTDIDGVVSIVTDGRSLVVSVEGAARE